MFCASGDPLTLHSFPTRRSSDLPLVGLPFVGDVEDVADLVPPVAAAVAVDVEHVRGRDRPGVELVAPFSGRRGDRDRKSTRLNSSHGYISYAVFCLIKKKNANPT